LPAVAAEPPAPPPPDGGTAPALPPWPVAEPPEPPLLWAVEPWPQPNDDAKNKRPAPANNEGTVFSNLVVMYFLFILAGF
jgi:hypothetical protein